MRPAWLRQQLYRIDYQWVIILGLHAYCFQCRVLYLVADHRASLQSKLLLPSLHLILSDLSELVK